MSDIVLGAPPVPSGFLADKDLVATWAKSYFSEKFLGLLATGEWWLANLTQAKAVLASVSTADKDLVVTVQGAPAGWEADDAYALQRQEEIWHFSKRSVADEVLDPDDYLFGWTVEGLWDVLLEPVIVLGGEEEGEPKALMTTLAADPDFVPPSLSIIVGAAPAPNCTNVGTNLYQLKFLKSKIQPAVWDFLKVNKHFVVNLQKCTAGVIVEKSSDATYYILKAEVEAGAVWTNGDPLVPQTQPLVFHFSHLKIAKAFARERDFILGWRDDNTWGLLRQARDYTNVDAEALGIKPGDDLDAEQVPYDLQLVTADSLLIGIAWSNLPHPNFNGLSDGLPPLEVRRRVMMTRRQAIELYEDMQAKQQISPDTLAGLQGG